MRKITAFILSFLLLCNQVGFAQIIANPGPAGIFGAQAAAGAIERFRPTHLRYFSYDAIAEKFTMLLDRGDAKDMPETAVKEEAGELLKFFLIGVSLPDDKFWVNLRPDSEDQIIDGALASTDIGRILLESDVQLKKDTASFTSPRCPQGKAYWDSLYQRAEELYAGQDFTIPALTRPWIVPDEIIIREDGNSAYIYKATLKVMLEEDYLKGSSEYGFSDPRQKALNEYSSQIIREKIIPQLNKEINTSKKYAALRQVYFSLILARWFKARFKGTPGSYAGRIDQGDLKGLTSAMPWSKDVYFQQYKRSFADGEYNIEEQVSGPSGQSIRVYLSGGIDPVPSIVEAVEGKLAKFTSTIAQVSSAIAVSGVALSEGNPQVEIVPVQQIVRQENISASSPSVFPEIKISSGLTRLTKPDFDLAKLIAAIGYTFKEAHRVPEGSGQVVDSVDVIPNGKKTPVAKIVITTVQGRYGETHSFEIRLNARNRYNTKLWHDVEDATLAVLSKVLPDLEYRRHIFESDAVDLIASGANIKDIPLGQKYISAGFVLKDLDFVGDKYRPSAADLLDERYTVNAYMIFSPAAKAVGQPQVAAVSSPSTNNKTDEDREPGGIDFRILPISFQAIGSISDLKLSLASVESISGMDVTQEISAIKRLVDRNMLPSDQRLKELLAACIQRGSTESQTTELLGCLVKICRLYEEQASPASKELREALLIVDSEEFLR